MSKSGQSGMNLRFSDYIVYVDESGDHGLKTIDPNYPIFVLAFYIFNKTDYWQQTVPSLQAFKFKHFGHDQVILHETDIRKDRGNFSCLNTKEIKDNFLSESSFPRSAWEREEYLQTLHGQNNQENK